MKKLTTTLIAVSRNIFLPAFIIIGLSITSCKKDNSMGKPAAPALDITAKSAKVKESTSKMLKDLVITFNNANQNAGSGNGSNSYSNSAANFTTYSTSSGTVSSWSDPTTGTSYTLTQASSSGSGSGSGSGIGQLSYGGKSFDYNYLLSFKTTDANSSWNFFGGSSPELRGAIAIDGQLTSTNFTLKNVAVFLVLSSNGPGTYKFIKWSTTNFVGNGQAFGELLDFSDVVNNTPAGLNAAKALLTSDGHITVSDQSFDMNSDAKVKNFNTGAEYTISGSLMFL